MSTESVLLIDDDAPARDYLERQLVEDGFAVLAAAETGDAFALAEAENPDVVLLGARLSSGSGFEMCRAFRSGEEGRTWNRDVPLIMLGATDDPVERIRGLTRGARCGCCSHGCARCSRAERLLPLCAGPATARRASGSRSARSRSSGHRASFACWANRSSLPPRNTSYWSRSRRSLSGYSRRKSFSGASGVFAVLAERARWIPTRAGCAANFRCAARPITSSTSGGIGGKPSGCVARVRPCSCLDMLGRCADNPGRLLVFVRAQRRKSRRVSPGAIRPIAHTIGRASTQGPRGEDTETTSAPAGVACSTVTPQATPGPRLLTVTV